MSPRYPSLVLSDPSSAAPPALTRWSTALMPPSTSILDRSSANANLLGTSDAKQLKNANLTRQWRRTLAVKNNLLKLITRQSKTIILKGAGKGSRYIGCDGRLLRVSWLINTFSGMFSGCSNAPDIRVQTHPSRQFPHCLTNN